MPLCLVLVTARSYGEDADYSHFLVSDRVNGTHTDLDTELAPVEVGPLTVTLRPTGERLEVVEHELALGPAGDGLHRARLRARYQGEADLFAVLEVAGVGSEIEDHLVLPLQEIEIVGLVEIHRQDEGLLITTVENPESVKVQIESNLADRVGLLCAGLAVMAMGGLDCAAVDRRLSVVEIPLPEAGREFFVPWDGLTAEERRQVEAYVGVP